MPGFRALILEDEEYNREFIKQILSEIPSVTEIFATAEGLEAAGWAEANRPHIALLDIELPGQKINGLDVARRISQLGGDTYIVFVTGYAKYALDSFDVHPYGFVPKPIKISKLRDLLEEIISRLERAEKVGSDVLTIKVNNEVTHLNLSDIVFIEVENHISLIHSLETTCEVRKSLKELEGMLGADFLRVHRSYIVNLTKIKKISETRDRSYEIEFSDYPKTALMSRYYYPKYGELYQRIK